MNINTRNAEKGSIIPIYQAMTKRVKKVTSRSIIVDKLISDTKLHEKGEKNNRRE